MTPREVPLPPWANYPRVSKTGKVTWLRLQPKIDFNAEGGCWVWNGGRLPEPEPYGRTNVGDKTWLAHRLVYTLLVGEIPEGKQLDHLCGNQPCVNPLHLEPVTAQENTLRAPHATATKHAAKTHCPHGHEYSPENTWMIPQAWNRERFARVCRTCYPGRRNLRTLAQHMADQESAA